MPFDVTLAAAPRFPQRPMAAKPVPGVIRSDQPAGKPRASAPHAPPGRLIEHPSPREHSQRSMPGDDNWGELAELAVQAAIWVRVCGRSWVRADLLVAGIAPGRKGEAWLARAIGAGMVKVRRGPMSAHGGMSAREVQMVWSHPMVQTVYYLLDWVPGRITYLLQTQRRRWVDTASLARDMRHDVTCRRRGIGQSEPDAERWLNRLAWTGVLIPRLQSDAASPERLVTTWWLPETDR